MRSKIGSEEDIFLFSSSLLMYVFASLFATLFTSDRAPRRKVKIRRERERGNASALSPATPSTAPSLASQGLPTSTATLFSGQPTAPTLLKGGLSPHSTIDCLFNSINRRQPSGERRITL